MARLRTAILGMQVLFMKSIQCNTVLPSPSLAFAFHPKLPSTNVPARRCTLPNRIAMKEQAEIKPGSYSLIDSGNNRRLERFDGLLVDRPCPAAEWRPGFDRNTWGSAQVLFELSEAQTKGAPKGSWKHSIEPPSPWVLSFEDSKVGVFPEQQDNWAWIRRTLQGGSALVAEDRIKVLNGFAYTGGSTIAAAAADPRVEVVHLDGSSPAVKWARANAAQAEIPETSVRWLCEDCMTFVSRELKRENKYHALIFDPPAFGRGGKGKVWKLNTDMPKLVAAFPQLLADEPLLVLLSSHDTAWPPRRLRDLLADALPPSLLSKGKLEAGDMLLEAEDAQGRPLRSGSYVRWSRTP